MGLKRIIILFGAVLSSAPTYAAKKACSISPTFVTTVAPNSSYLDPTFSLRQYNHRRIDNVNDWIFDPSKARELRQQYEDMVRMYNHKERFRQNTPQDYKTMEERQLEFRAHAMKSALDYQIDTRLEEAESNSDNVRTFVDGVETVESVAKGDIDTNIWEEFKFGTKTDIPGQRGRVWMASPIVNSSFDVVVRDPLIYDPFEDTLGLGDRGEKYRMTMGRELSWLGMNSEVSYGTTTTKIKGHLTKAIYRNVTAKVSGERGIDPGKAGIPGGYQHELRVDYSIRF